MSTVLLLALPASGFAYVLIALLIGGESMGIPLPGETALIAAAVLASQGKLSLTAVIAIAAAAAIVGDNFGYLFGRKGARRLLERPGRFEDHRRELLRRGEAFFKKHGGKTVFLGRWLPFLRITAAWLAGANHMAWPKFLAWNAAGGIAWAVSIGVLAYYVGNAAIAVIHTVGLAAIVVFAVVVVGIIAWALLKRRRNPS
ncbi:MAG: DedA family protein [Actinomycetota bacterium]